ncbi:hypothetical protein [Nocardia tengchongensis]|uniref:hypothetical protein n=1 Tax=Nocardia tengchongensis TaxID=2055889 RepID=UPI00367B4780
MTHAETEQQHLQVIPITPRQKFRKERLKPMNKFTRTAVTSTLATATLCLMAGTATADPATDSTLTTDIAPGVRYTGNTSDNSATVDTAFGSFVMRDGQFQLRDSHGSLVVGNPAIGGPQPVAAIDSGSDAAAEPSAPETPALWNEEYGPGPVPDAPARVATGPAAPTLPLQNVDATADFNGALGVVATQFGLATGVGTLAGGIIGAGLGCAGGALTGGFAAIPTGPIAVPAAALGCVVGASVGIALGSVAGAALLGIPVGIASGVQMYNSLHDQGSI